MLILGIDPGLQKTGWGLIRSEGRALKFIASGLIKTAAVGSANAGAASGGSDNSVFGNSSSFSSGTLGSETLGSGAVGSSAVGSEAVGSGSTTRTTSLASRLSHLHIELCKIIETWAPDEAAVEETFVNRNPASALKLGQARGVALAVPALYGLPVAEYAANKVKKAVVGAGHADKTQIGAMVRILLPACGQIGEDEADALAVAICHAHYGSVRHIKLANEIGNSNNKIKST